MGEHRIFRSGMIPVILLVTGIEHYTENFIIAVIAGVGIYSMASLVDDFFKKR